MGFETDWLLSSSRSAVEDESSHHFAGLIQSATLWSKTTLLVAPGLGVTLELRPLDAPCATNDMKWSLRIERIDVGWEGS